MADPLSLETIVGEFTEDSEAWVLQDTQSKKYLVCQIIQGRQRERICGPSAQ